MLRQEMCLPTSPYGLNSRFWYFCIQNCFVRRCSKLHVMDLNKFNLFSLHVNVVLRFYQDISKNWQIDITWCFINQHQFVVDCLIFYVIKIYKGLVCYHHLYGLQTNQVCIHCFYTLRLSRSLLMRYCLCLVLLGIINFVSFWTSWMLIFFIYTQNSCITNGLMCLNYMDGRGICTLRIWYGGNWP